jgi:hypothetical protein
LAGGAARYSQPKPHVDEQPARRLSRGLDDAMRAFCPSAASVDRGAVPKLSQTISDESFDNSWVLNHGAFLSTRNLVTRVLVTRDLVNP